MCLNLIELVEKVIVEGVIYVVFGVIYVIEIKLEVGNIGLEILKEVKFKLNVLICVIGGLIVENLGEVIEVGVDFCVVISDILGLLMFVIFDCIEQWVDLFVFKV